MNTSTASIIQAWFPHRVYINLDRRPERRQQAIEQFRLHGLEPVTRFAARDATQMEIPTTWRAQPGGFGCTASHLDIVRDAKQRGLPSILIFEDDVVFDEDLEARLHQVLAELPSDWDMFSFGGSHREPPEQVTEHIYRMRKTYSTHGYVIRDTLYDAFIDINTRSDYPVDMNNHHLQQRYNCYCAIPHLAWQRDGWSDIQLKPESHWAIRESLILVGDEVDRLLADTTVILAFQHRGHNGLSLRNLHHVLSFYQKHLPQLELVVTADARELSPEQLPDYCRFVPIVAANPPDRDRLFRSGFEASPDRRHFIFSDASVRPSQDRFVRPNLLMSRKHGGTTFFHTLIHLNSRDSELIRNGQEVAVHIENYAESEASAEAGAFVLSRETLTMRNGRPITDLQDQPLFRASNRGLVLNCHP